MIDIYRQRRQEVHSNTSISYTRDVSCNGNFLLNAPEQEHPLVYYVIPYESNQVACEYCGKTFAYVESEI